MVNLSTIAALYMLVQPINLVSLSVTAEPYTVMNYTEDVVYTRIWKCDEVTLSPEGSLLIDEIYETLFGGDIALFHAYFAPRVLKMNDTCANVIYRIYHYQEKLLK